MRAERAADLLWHAWQTGERLPGLPDDACPRDRAEAMAAQECLAGLAGPVFGWKIAATTELAQRYLGVGGPLPGMLFERFPTPKASRFPRTR